MPLLNFTLPSRYSSSYSASNCNNGLYNDFCHSATSDNNPTLLIQSPVAFDTVIVYNRQKCCQNRISNATITLNVIGKPSYSKKFPTMPATSQPSSQPSQLSTQPSFPTTQPSLRRPSVQPSSQPSSPSTQPSITPTCQPSKQPLRQCPSIRPSLQIAQRLKTWLSNGLFLWLQRWQ